MDKIVLPCSREINAVLDAQPSKSMAQRALAIALLARGESIIYGIGNSEDVKNMKNAIVSLGAQVTETSGYVKVKGPKALKPCVINCGESGLAMRTLSMIALACDGATHIKCEGSLVSRPKSQILSAIESVGGKAKIFRDGSVMVMGKPRRKKAKIQASTTSQILSGLLMVAPKLRGLHIDVSDLKSKSYVDATIHLMKHFGVKVHRRKHEMFSVTYREKYEPRHYTVEGDWSGAANLLVAGAIAGEVTVRNLSVDSLQPDKNIIEVLRSVGAIVEVSENFVRVKKSRLSSFSFDITDCPDLAPPLVALAVHCEGVSRIKGVHRLREKESDRATALAQEFGKLGISIMFDEDDMIVVSGKIKGGEVWSHRDHRIAMSLAVSSLKGAAPVKIIDTECVNKSYPEFWQDFELLCESSYI